MGVRALLSDFADEAARTHYTTVYDEAFAGLPAVNERRTVETDYGSVCCYEFGTGDGTPLTLLAGRNAATPMWAPNLPALAANRRVICIDAIGEAGMSTQTAPIATSADHGLWVEQALDGLDVSTTHLVGASLGGWTAMHVAAHSRRVRSLTLVDAVTTFAKLRAGFIAAGMLAQSPLVTARRRRRLLAWIAGGEEDSSPQARLGIAALRGFRVKQAPPKLLSDEHLAAVHVPVLALIAGRSRVHNPADAVARAHQLPTATVEMWPDAGHALNAQFPDRFNSRILEFVSDIDDEGREPRPSRP